MPFHSTRKNTALCDTAFKGETTGTGKSDIAEIPTVHGAVGSLQDDNKSHQGSPVTMEYPTGDSPPSNARAASYPIQIGGVPSILGFGFFFGVLLLGVCVTEGHRSLNLSL